MTPGASCRALEEHWRVEEVGLTSESNPHRHECDSSLETLVLVRREGQEESFHIRQPGETLTNR